jgi:hypothetical protein
MSGATPKVSTGGCVDLEKLRARLKYDPETGVFTWIFKHCGVRTGAAAGGLNQEGYIQIKFDRCNHRAHRLAWLFVYGVMPTAGLDHINGDRTDNRIQNLREATPAQNAANHKMLITNTSGFRGVRWNAKDRKWTAGAKHMRKYHYLGRFSTPEEAAQAYDAFVIAKHGEFARPNNPINKDFKP